MPSRAEDYEVLYTIGAGSYGRCQKIRRKSDGKVSAGSLPVSAPAAVAPARGERPWPPGGGRARGLGLWVSRAGCLEESISSRSVSVLARSRAGTLRILRCIYVSLLFSFTSLSLFPAWTC